MQLTTKEQAQELIKINLNKLLETPYPSLGNKDIEKQKLDYFTIIAKTISINNINFILDYTQMTPEQSVSLKELKTEIFNTID